MESNVVRLGIDIGSTTVKVAFIDENGGILYAFDETMVGGKLPEDDFYYLGN